MKLQKQKTFGLLVLAIFLLIDVIFLFRQKSIWDLERLLSDVSISNISVDGHIYSIKNGQISQKVDYGTTLKILRLVSFYQWNKENPIFDSPDLNPEGLRLSSKSLDLIQGRLLSSVHQNNPLFPTSFLEALVVSSKQNRVFLSHLSLDEAKKLLSTQKAALNKYSSSAEALINFIGNPVPEDRTMFNTQSNEQIILSDYQKIIENSNLLENEIVKREGCLEGRDQCERPIKSLSNPGSKGMLTSLNNPNFIDKSLIFKQYFDHKTEFNVRGPYRIKTDCFGFKSDLSIPEHYFYLAQVPASETIPAYSEVVLATDVYFRKLNSQNQIENKLISTGQSYTNQPSSTPYECMDSGYMNQIQELDSFLITQKPILAQLDVSSDAKKAEVDLFTDPYPSYEELSNLADYYGYLYSDPKLAYIKDELLTKYLLIKGSFAYYEQSVAREVPIMNRFTNSVLLNPLDSNTIFDYLYAFRSDYSLMYLAFSKAGWFLDTKPQFLEKRIITGAISPTGGFISLSQAKSIYPEAIIDSWYLDLNPLYDQAVKDKSIKVK